MRDKEFFRITAILGAGAVLDFDYNDLIRPTTNNITKAVVDQKIQGLDLKDSDLIRQIYDLIVEKSRTAYLRFHPDVRFYEPPISFEDVFEVIETLYSYTGTWKSERYPFPLISSLVRSDLHFESIEYYRAMVSFIEKIVEIVDAYDTKFRTDGTEQWYKDFWKGFGGKVDVFNLNYDTTVEFSMGEYNDGFVGFTQDYERFEPGVLWNASLDCATVNHLHGCILYGDTNPRPVQYHYSHRDLYKFYSAEDVKKYFINRQWMPSNQVGDSIYYSPIITGLKKTDKICYLPHSVYHAHLVKKIIENPSLLICGYSFGDLYINQLLQRHKLIHGDNQRVVIVEKWPDYVNKDCISLYRYFEDHTSGGFREFVSRITEGGLDMLDVFKQFKQFDEGCWESSNGALRLYTKGFKYAVDNGREDIMCYLN